MACSVTMPIMSTPGPATPARPADDFIDIQPMHFPNPAQLSGAENNKHIANAVKASSSFSSTTYHSPSDTIHSPATMKIAAFRHKQNVYGSRKSKPLFRSMQARQQKLRELGVETSDQGSQPMFADISRRK